MRRELAVTVCERQCTVGYTGHIPKHVDGASEYRETKDIGEIKLNGCWSGTGVRACIDEVLAGRQDRDDYLNTRSLLLTIRRKTRPKLLVTVWTAFDFQTTASPGMNMHSVEAWLRILPEVFKSPRFEEWQPNAFDEIFPP